MDCERGGSRSTLISLSIRSGNHLRKVFDFDMESLVSATVGLRRICNDQEIMLGVLQAKGL